MPDQSVKATVQVGETKVTFEGPRDFVEAQVSKYTASHGKPQGAGSADKEGSTPGDLMSERGLVESKRPSGHLETVAVLAFALAQKGVEEFTDEDIRRAYLRAGVRPPKVVSQAVRDAKNRMDLIEPGSKRGTYRLSAHGDRTVRFDLPR
ncbi:MAG: hypothetical protein ACLPXM_02520 [Terriglobales bacterium]